MPVAYASHSLNHGVGTTATAVGNKPASVVEGDLLLSVLWCDASGGSATITAPSGWELVENEGLASETKAALFWKNAGVAEPSSWNFDLDTGAFTVAWIAGVFRITGHDAAAPINAKGKQVNISSAACTAPSITTDRDGCLLLFVGCDPNGRTYSTPVGMQQRWYYRNNTGSLDISQIAATESQATASSTGTRAAALNAPTNNIGFLVAIAPPTAGGGGFNPALYRSTQIIGAGLR